MLDANSQDWDYRVINNQWKSQKTEAPAQYPNVSVIKTLNTPFAITLPPTLESEWMKQLKK